MPSRTLNRLLWMTMLALIVIFAVQARDHFEMMFVGVGSLDVRDAPNDDAVYLTWRGKIDAPMASRIAEAFAAHKHSRSRVILALSSPGGSLTHGALVVRELQAIARTHQLETVVEARGRCASMCVPIYLQGETRIAAGAARFMFHEVSFREIVSDEAVDVPASARRSATEKFFATYFRPAGVPQSWIAGVLAAMAGGRDVWKRADELVAEDAHIVQRTF